MSTMTDTETYNGWKNRETWAFNLHWQNDQGLYSETLEAAGPFWRKVSRTPDTSEVAALFQLGDYIISYWRDRIDWDRSEMVDGVAQSTRLAMLEREVGSWWRVDPTETGAAIRESLSNEGEG